MTKKYVPRHFKAEDLAAWMQDDPTDGLENTGVIKVRDVAQRLETMSSDSNAPAKADDVRQSAAIAKSDDPVKSEDEPAAKNNDTGSEESVGRSAAMMSGLVIASRITGFARTWGQAMALGVTVVSSCYTVANNLPNMLYELVMGGMLATAFLPVYLSVKEKAGREGSNRYTSNLLSIVVLLMGILAALGIVFAGQVVWTQSFGATSEFDFNLASYFFRFFAIEIVLYALSSVISGVLNAERDYLWSNAAPIFNNIVCTASFFLYAAFAQSNPSLAILCLALGNPLGVAIQVLMQLPSLRKHGIRLRPTIDFHDPALRETLSIGIPSLIITVCSFITVSVQNSSALSVTVSGSSIAYYTRIWYTLPYSIFAIPITTAMFTELSSYVSKGDMGSYVRGISFGTGRIFFWLVPFALYLMVFSEPLITLMAGGKFTADQITLTAQYLMVLATSMPAYGLGTYLQKACSSLRKMMLYAGAIVIGSLLQVAFCLVLTPMFGLMMVALSSTFFFVLTDVVTFAFLRHELGPMGLKALLVSLLRSLAVGVAGAAVGWGLLFGCTHVFGPLGGSAFRAVLYTVAAGVPSVLVTYGLALLLRFPESSAISSVVSRFLPKRVTHGE